MIYRGKVFRYLSEVRCISLFFSSRKSGATIVSLIVLNSYKRSIPKASFPNQIWQCDVMHGPSVKRESGPQKKSYLWAIMDDHSRLIIHAQFYLNETLESLKDCLMQGMSKRGPPGKFYVDNGSCYRARNLEQILASLGTALVHSRPYIPQGRGKIERWFRYVRQDFLTVNADRPFSLQDLNERLETWVDEYNANPHSSIKMSPYDKFRADLECIRPAPTDLLNYFRKIEQRKVKKDRTIQLNTRIFEAPVTLIDKKVELYFHDAEPDVVEVFFEGRTYGMAVIMDPHINSRIGRDYPSGTDPKARSKSVYKGSFLVFDGSFFGHYLCYFGLLELQEGWKLAFI